MTQPTVLLSVLDELAKLANEFPCDPLARLPFVLGLLGVILIAGLPLLIERESPFRLLGKRKGLRRSLSSLNTVQKISGVVTASLLLLGLTWSIYIALYRSDCYSKYSKPAGVSNSKTIKNQITDIIAIQIVNYKLVIYPRNDATKATLEVKSAGGGQANIDVYVVNTGIAYWPLGKDQFPGWV